MSAPNPPSILENVLGYLQDHSRYVEMQLRNRTPDNVAKHSVILLSPNGSAWEITIDNAGALVTTKVFDAGP